MLAKISHYLDPYGISAMGTRWSDECETQIKTYFQFLVDSIRNGDQKNTKLLLNALHEVDEVGLGYSSEEPSGRGIGREQAEQIQAAFEDSEAVKSGDIKDLADCALMIPGINRDKISDITANILKQQLIDFTQKQCKKHSIPMKKVPVGNVFDYRQFKFVSQFAQLPIVYGKPKILLPISSVRHVPELGKDKFYRNFVLEFLRAEHHHAGDSLATVLKNGKIVVRIRDLKEKYPLRSKFLYEFSKKHPRVLETYKSELRKISPKAHKSPHLAVKVKVLSADDRVNILKGIDVGKAEAYRFHNFIFVNLIYILGKRLAHPIKEREINDGRKRIDIVFDNDDKDGFFYKLNTLYHIKCPKIFVECKNYGSEIGNPELDQLLGRFSDKRGKFGIIICRSIQDKELLKQRCKDLVNGSGNYIIALDDLDIETLLHFKEERNDEAIDNLLKDKVDELIM